MSANTRQETMKRKPILMPPKMISRIDEIAKDRNVSFAEVVREAVNAFDNDMTRENITLVEALADNMIETTRNLVKKIDEIEKRLDETHSILEVQ